MTTPIRCLGVDFSSVFRRYWSSNSDSPDRDEAVQKSTVDLITTLRQGHDRVALLLDETTDGADNLFRGTSWRRFVEPRYKWNREPMSAAYFDRLRKTIDRLECDGCIAFCAPELDLSKQGGPVTGMYLEGDDLCASLATWCTAHRFSLTLYSSDKDVLQLVSDTSDICVIREPDEKRLPEGRLVWKEADVAMRLEKGKQDGKDVWRGVPPRLVPDYLALAGDGADNFDVFPGWEDPSPGLAPDGSALPGQKHPGIGGGTACKLLAQFPKGLLSMIDQLEKDASAFGNHHAEVLRRGLPSPREAAMRGLLLATLCRTAGPDYNCLLEPPVYKPIAKPRTYFMTHPHLEPDHTAVSPAPSPEDLARLAAIDAGKEDPLEVAARDALRAQLKADLANAIEEAIAKGVAASKEADQARRADTFNAAKAELTEWCIAHNVDPMNPRAAMFQRVKEIVAEERARAAGAPPYERAATAEERAAALPPNPAPNDAPAAPLATRPQQALAKPAMTASLALSPRNLPELMEWAAMAHNSRLFQHLPNPEAVAMVALEAMERGLGLVTALRNSNVINGKVGWSAAAIVGFVKASGLCEYFRVVESTWDSATVEFKRVDEPAPTRYTATTDDATRKGFITADGKGVGYPVWKKDRKLMLVWMATREACRMYFMEVCSGVHTPDELPGGDKFNGEMGSVQA